MAIVLKDRVKQTAAAPGTGTITLGATAAGFQAFSAIGNGNVTYFAIVDNVSGAWEVNYGTYTSSGTTLSRNATFDLRFQSERADRIGARGPCPVRRSPVLATSGFRLPSANGISTARPPPSGCSSASIGCSTGVCAGS
jgi:hypothetical protein